MRFPRLSVRRWALLAAAILIVAGVAAPYLSAEFIGDRVRQALERSLNRKVEIEAARFSLFRGPGFSLLRAIIHDDPAAGAEPFAHVETIEARISLLGLLRGRLEFASLRLDQPSVNLVKTESGPWNFQSLLNPTAARRIPAVSINDGRLNFKLGGVKSVFYFSNADLELSPPRTPGGAFTIEVSGEPTRTDRTARGFGTLSGRGRWRPSAEPGGNLDLLIRLNQSPIGELATLIHGHDIGVHGQVSGQATLHGPLSGLEVGGTLQLSEIHRWDLLPPYAQGGPLNFRGTLDALNQSLDLETVPSPQTALSVHFRAMDYLVRPRWVLGVSLNGVALPPLVDVARHMGAGPATQVKMDGTVTGALAYSPGDGFQGSVSLNGTTVIAPGGPVARLEDVRLVLDGQRVSMPGAALAIGETEKATLQFDYDLVTQALDLKLMTEGMSVAALQSAGGPLPGLIKPGFVNDLRGGTWGGWLQYRRHEESPGEWSGSFALKRTQAVIPGLAAPLDVFSAAVQLQGERVQAEHIRAAAAGLEIGGDYLYRPGAERPHRIICRVERLRASDLQRILGPTLRRPQSFLSRTLRLSRPSAPAWLAGRFAQGSLSVRSLEIAGEVFEQVRLDFFWDGFKVDVPRFTAQVTGGRADGHLSIDLSGPEPTYRVSGRAESVIFRGGRLDGDALLSTSGFGENLYRNLHAEGSFRLLSAALTGDTPIPFLAGEWGVLYERNQPRLELSALRMIESGEVFTGKGTTTEDDRIVLELAGGDRRLRLAGTLRPLHLETAESR